MTIDIHDITASTGDMSIATAMVTAWTQRLSTDIHEVPASTPDIHIDIHGSSACARDMSTATAMSPPGQTT